jgi:hypothetical protein
MRLFTDQHVLKNPRCVAYDGDDGSHATPPHHRCAVAHPCLYVLQDHSTQRWSHHRVTWRYSRCCAVDVMTETRAEHLSRYVHR